MEKPIEAGCKAVVIDGLLGARSPNIGLIVKVLRYLGDEITLGRIWRCETDYAETVKLHSKETPKGTADFAQSWLKRLPDDPLPGVSAETKEELST